MLWKKKPPAISCFLWKIICKWSQNPVSNNVNFIHTNTWLTINKVTFLWYISDLTSLSLEDVDSVSEADRDTLAPLPPPHWNNQYPYSNTSYLPQNLGYIPPYSYTSTDSQSFIGSYVDGVASEKSIAIGGNTTGGGNGSAGSVHSASGNYKLWKFELSCIFDWHGLRHFVVVAVVDLFDLLIVPSKFLL